MRADAAPLTFNVRHLGSAGRRPAGVRADGEVHRVPLARRRKPRRITTSPTTQDKSAVGRPTPSSTPRAARSDEHEAGRDDGDDVQGRTSPQRLGLRDGGHRCGIVAIASFVGAGVMPLSELGFWHSRDVDFRAVLGGRCRDSTSCVSRADSTALLKVRSPGERGLR